MASKRVDILAPGDLAEIGASMRHALKDFDVDLRPGKNHELLDISAKVVVKLLIGMMQFVMIRFKSNCF